MDTGGNPAIGRDGLIEREHQHISIMKTGSSDISVSLWIGLIYCFFYKHITLEKKLTLLTGYYFQISHCKKNTFNLYQKKNICVLTSALQTKAPNIGVRQWCAANAASTHLHPHRQKCDRRQIKSSASLSTEEWFVKQDTN